MSMIQWMSNEQSPSLTEFRKYELKKVYVSNIPYNFKWKDLKVLFEKEGDVIFVVLYKNEKGHFQGRGTVEFGNANSVQKAIDKMNNYKLNGRKFIVEADKEKYDNCRSDFGGGIKRTPVSDDFRWSNTYGLSPTFLSSLNIHTPLNNRIYVSNINYIVDESKLKEVFGLAGRVLKVDLFLNKEGKSLGCSVIHYIHPVEAVQAISMLNKQILFDRPMYIRLDQSSNEHVAIQLPEGLKNIGIGLGANGTPLHYFESILQ